MDSTSPLFDTLVKAGLEPTSAEVYITLIGLGEASVGAIEKQTPFSRATLYDALSTLLAAGYLEYRKEGRNAYYKPVHPQKLEELITQKKRETALLETELGEAIRSLTGSFNLTLNKPGVKFYEGKEGVIQAYEAILNLQKPIDSIEDKGEMAEFIPDYFPKFIQKRIEKKLFNRVVAPSTNPINVTSEKEFRETRSIPVDQFPFSMDIKICANTVLFVTLKQGHAIAIMMDDPLIAENFKLIFSFFWNHAASKPASPPTVVPSN